MNNEQKPLYEYTATSFVTLTSDEFKAMQAELERLRKRLEFFEAYVEELESEVGLDFQAGCMNRALKRTGQPALYEDDENEES